MKQKIKILSLNSAPERGRKYPADQLILEKEGIRGDAHMGTERPVSMFDQTEAERFYRITGARQLESGQFAENILFKAEKPLDIKIFDRFVKEELVLEVIRKGKPFHDEFREPGNYVMPREGIFCRVLNEGTLKAVDEMEYLPKVFTARVITLSDRASRGVYEDKSGPAVAGMLEKRFEKMNWRLNIHQSVIPDDAQKLREILDESVEQKIDIIITTGGTGIGPRDITPDVMRDFISKEIPGIMEMIRWKYGIEKPAALVSRAVAGVNGKTLMFALPGSVKAVNEYMTEINKHLRHLVYMLESIDMH